MKLHVFHFNIIASSQINKRYVQTMDWKMCQIRKILINFTFWTNDQVCVIQIKHLTALIWFLMRPRYAHTANATWMTLVLSMNLSICSSSLNTRMRCLSSLLHAKMQMTWSGVAKNCVFKLIRQTCFKSTTK